MMTRQEMMNGGPRQMPPQAMAFRWWGQVRQRQFSKISPWAEGYASASTNPDIDQLSRLKILDTTLRDGGQMPNAFLTEGSGRSVMQNRVEIGIKLAQFGIPLIEAGNAVSSQEEIEVIRAVKDAVARMGLQTEIVSLARMTRRDIDAALASGADTLHIFHSGSIPHTGVKFGKLPEDFMEAIGDAVRYGKAIGFQSMIVSLDHGTMFSKNIWFQTPNARVPHPSQLKQVQSRSSRLTGSGLTPGNLGLWLAAARHGTVTERRRLPWVPVSIPNHGHRYSQSIGRRRRWGNAGGTVVAPFAQNWVAKNCIVELWLVEASVSVNVT